MFDRFLKNYTSSSSVMDEPELSFVSYHTNSNPSSPSTYSAKTNNFSRKTDDSSSLQNQSRTNMSMASSGCSSVSSSKQKFCYKYINMIKIFRQSNISLYFLRISISSPAFQVREILMKTRIVKIVFNFRKFETLKCRIGTKIFNVEPLMVIGSPLPFHLRFFVTVFYIKILKSWHCFFILITKFYSVLPSVF